MLAYNMTPFSYCVNIQYYKKHLLPKGAYNDKLTMVNLGSEIIDLFSLCFS